MRSPLVLLLAGWGTDPRRLAPLTAALDERDLPARLWPYHPTGTIASLAEQLRDIVQRVGDRPVHLVGHSFGGILSAAAALADSSRVASVTTINTPWRGTWVSYTGSSRLADALRWRSEELAALRHDLRAHLREPDGPSWLLVSVLGDLATPATTSLRAGGRARRLRRAVVPANGHSISLLLPRLHGVVVDHVERTEQRLAIAHPA